MSQILKKACLLVAEDEALVAMEIECSLEELDYKVCGVATTAPEAITLAQRHRPDLALVDVNLANGTNGLHAVRVLREDLGIPAIIVSGHANAEDASQAGAMGWIAKPYRFEQILEAVEYVLEAREGTPSRPRPRGIIEGAILPRRAA